MKVLKGERCPYCGGHAPTRQTDTAKVFDPDEVFKGVRIAKHRYQYRVCLQCGRRGCTPVFIGATDWGDDGDEYSAVPGVGQHLDVKRAESHSV